MIKSLVLVLTTIILVPSLGWAQNAATAETAASKKAWRINMTAEFAPKVRASQEDLGSYSVIGDYFLNDKHRLRVRQDWQQVYTKYSSEHEFQPFNTRLFHYYKFDKKLGPLSFMWRGDVALPVSDLSQQDDLITAFTGMMFIDGTRFFNNRLILSFRPFVRYNWYEFRTTAGGRLLPEWTFGQVLLAIVPVTSKFTIIGAGVYTLNAMHSSQYDPNFVQKEQGLYSVSTTFDYSFYKNMSAYVSYFQGPAQYIVDGRYELLAFDPHNSRYSIGLAATF